MSYIFEHLNYKIVDNTILYNIYCTYGIEIKRRFNDKVITNVHDNFVSEKSSYYK